MDGGAVYLGHGSEARLMQTVFDSNYALHGGALALYLSYLISDDCRYVANSARSGGALSISTESFAHCTNDLYINNSASDSGGSILLQSSSFVNISRYEYYFSVISSQE